MLIPYPGPGWLVVFAGLAILATEFAWAGRLLVNARAGYAAWSRWLAARHWAVRVLVLAGTCAIVLVTLWALGTVGWVAGWFGLKGTWLRGPFG